MLKKNLFKKVSSAVLAMCFFVCLDFGCLAMYPNAGENPTEDEFGIGSDEIEVDPEGDGTNGPSYEERVIECIMETANKELGNEFGISSNEVEVDPEGDGANGPSYEERVIECIMKTANKALGNDFGIGTSYERKIDFVEASLPVGHLTSLSTRAAEKKLDVITKSTEKNLLTEDQIQNEGNQTWNNKYAQTIETGICSDEEVQYFSDYESDGDENSQNELNDEESRKICFKTITPKISKVVINGPRKADVYSDVEVLPLGSEEKNE